MNSFGVCLIQVQCESAAAGTSAGRFGRLGGHAGRIAAGPDRVLGGEERPGVELGRLLSAVYQYMIYSLSVVVPAGDVCLTVTGGQ